MTNANPILDELDGLSPSAKQALAQAHSTVVAAQPDPNLGTTGGTATPASPPPAPAPAQPAAVRPMAAPAQTAPTLGPSTTPANPVEAGHQANLARLTKPPVPGQHDKTQTGESGIGQIHNPWARIPLQIADAFGGGLFPGIEAGIPGTQLHHNLLVHQAERDVNQDEAGAQKEAETTELGAKTAEDEARAQALLHPQPKEEESGKTITTDQGIKQWNPETQRYDISAGNSPAKPDKYSFQQTDQGLMRIDNQSGEATPVSFNGQPLKGKSKVETTKIQREVNGKPHTILANSETGEDIKDEGETGEKPPVVNVNANERADKKEQQATKQSAYKAFTPSLDSAERFNVMAKNYEDAVKDHNQQAMLLLLANHLGMTMGLQKGARMTRDIIREAQQSTPWLQGLEAKFDKDGYLSGVTLTPQQMRQMVDLGRDRFSQDLSKSRSEAKYLGSTDDGPERTPNRSTINFYLGQTGGDVQKAKQLAAADGWSVK